MLAIALCRCQDMKSEPRSSTDDSAVCERVVEGDVALDQAAVAGFCADAC